MTSFKGRYAKYYDLIYSDKNYEMECSFLEEVFRQYAAVKVERIIDLSCGTGGHIIPLAKRGYSTWGVDSSAPMIRLAREKAFQAGCKTELRSGSMTRIPFRGKFEACISMFDSIDYLQRDADVVATFGSVSSHLVSGGIFVLQFWNGPAVLKLGPTQRHKVVENGELKLIRLSDSSLVTNYRSCRVSYRLIVIRGAKMIDDFREDHLLRYFDPDCLCTLLERSGLTVLKVLRPYEVGKEADDNDWSVIAVAKKG